VTRRTRFTRITISVLGLLAAVAPSASAGPLVASAPSCVDRAFEQPFLPWADVANYVQAPDAGFEDGGNSWSLSGGAAVVGGNEPFNARGAGDSHSLSLPAGSSAQSSVMCVGLEHPTLRVFHRLSGGSAFSRLQVEVVFEDAQGTVRDLTIGTLSGSSWAPSTPMAVVVNLLALLPGEHTPVAFRFTPSGSGTWSVDDVYVDPYGKY
jgi:hypothetical protein